MTRKKNPEQIKTVVNNFPVFLHVKKKNNLPAIEIRKFTCNPEAIKIIIDCAVFLKPILVFPTFRDRLRAMAALSQNKIIQYDPEKKVYKYLI